MPQTVILTDSSTVLARHGRELIRLDRQEIQLSPEIVDRARTELLARDQSEGPGFRFGFLLGVEDQRSAPFARSVVADLQRELVDPVGACRATKFSLSFVKAVDGVAPEMAEGPLSTGFHLDTHPQVTTDDGPELLRILVNLDRRPRTLRFVCADRFELGASGFELPRSSYRVVGAPPSFGQSTVDIPPFDGAAISYLTFWASLVPHVGVERPGGHFLASFEAPTDW